MGTNRASERYMVGEYALTICKILDLADIRLIFSSEKMQTKSMMACADVENGIVYVRPKMKENLDTRFAVAHELRHIWQFRTDKEKYFANYKTAEELDLETYNLQAAEVDANAFSVIVMVDLYGIKPTFDNLPKEIRAIIYQKADEIAENLQN